MFFIPLKGGLVLKKSFSYIESALNYSQILKKISHFSESR